MPPDLPERVTVLERRIDSIDHRLERIEDQLANMAKRFEDQFLALATATARIEGQLKYVPTTWQMLVGLFGSQATLAGLLFGAFKLGSGH